MSKIDEGLRALGLCAAALQPPGGMVFRSSSCGSQAAAR
jgi:hypothetical protein